MRFHRFRTALLMLALATAGAAARPARADVSESAGDPSARADELFRRGKALVKSGNLEAAREAYLEGYNLKRGFDIAGNLGNVELELGLARDAAEHLAYCIRNFPATGTPKQLEYARERFAEARRRVGAVAVRVNVGGAEIFVDGRSVGRAPLPDELYVEPGARAIEAKLGGYQPARRVVDAAAGGAHEASFHLSPVQQKPMIVVNHAPFDAGAREPPRKKSLVPVFVGVGAAVAGIAVGVGGFVASHARGADADARHRALEKSGGGSACLDDANDGACAALDQAYTAEARLRGVGIAGFSIAGAAAIATAVYALVPVRSPPQTGVRPQVLAGPSGASLGFTGRF